MSEPRILVWPDIWFAARVTHDTYALKFELFEMTSQRDDGSEFGYRRDGADDMTNEIQKAEAMAEGLIKWDGCMHYTIEQNAHACGLRHFKQLASAFERLYDEAKKVFSAEYPELWK